MKIKCALGIFGAREKVGNLIEAVKTALLKEAGKPADFQDLYPSRKERSVRARFFDEERRTLDEVWDVFQPADQKPETMDTEDITIEEAFASTNVEFDPMFYAHIEPQLK